MKNRENFKIFAEPMGGKVVDEISILQMLSD